MELALVGCTSIGLPKLTSIVVKKDTGKPAAGYPLETWEDDVDGVFEYQNWPEVDEIDWEYVWNNRVILSDEYGTKGYWKS